MKASARIQVTLDVPISDAWNEDPNNVEVLASIRQQAIAAAYRRLADVLQGNGGVRVVGEPKVTIVLMEDV
jgi:hypothetical protein